MRDPFADPAGVMHKNQPLVNPMAGLMIGENCNSGYSDTAPDLAGSTGIFMIQNSKKAIWERDSRKNTDGILSMGNLKSFSDPV